MFFSKKKGFHTQKRTFSLSFFRWLVPFTSHTVPSVVISPSIPTPPEGSVTRSFKTFSGSWFKRLLRLSYYLARYQLFTFCKGAILFLTVTPDPLQCLLLAHGLKYPASASVLALIQSTLRLEGRMGWQGMMEVLSFQLQISVHTVGIRHLCVCVSESCHGKNCNLSFVFFPVTSIVFSFFFSPSSPVELLWYFRH